MQNKYPLPVAGLVGGLVIIGIIIALLRSAPQEAKAPGGGGEPQKTTGQSGNAAAGQDNAGQNSYVGQLKLSDTPARGNLMLVMSNRAVYLRTDRNYSALLDQQVAVEIEGDLQNFRLLDIKKAQ